MPGRKDLPPYSGNNPKYRNRRGQPRYKKDNPEPTSAFRDCNSTSSENEGHNSQESFLAEDSLIPSSASASPFSAIADAAANAAYDNVVNSSRLTTQSSVNSAAQSSPLTADQVAHRDHSSSSHPGFLTALNPARRIISVQSCPSRRICGASAARRRSMASPKREASAPASVLGKRAAEDDHQPAVSSPLNPDFGQSQTNLRGVRSKKESLKKRESKGASLPSERATPDPKQKPVFDPNNPPRYKLPPPMASDFKLSSGPHLTASAHVLKTYDGQEIPMYTTAEHVHNKRGFRYERAIADPAFPHSQMYRATEDEPYVARASFEDSSEDLLFDESGTIVTTLTGWRVARANVCAREGRHFCEITILRGVPQGDIKEHPLWDKNMQQWAGSNVRMGFVRREAPLDMPVGYGPYGYGLRDLTGTRLWISRPMEFFPPGENVAEGDVIGLEIYLPSLELHKKVVTGSYNPAVDAIDNQDTSPETMAAIRDRVPIRYKGHLYFEHSDCHPYKKLDDLKFPHPTTDGNDPGVRRIIDEISATNPEPPFRTLPGSYIKVYKNGVSMGTMFDNIMAFLPPASKPNPTGTATDALDDGSLGYYPAISVLRGSAAQFNFGPDFKYPLESINLEEVDMVGNDQGPAPASGANQHAFSDRYNDQIAEDILADVTDEVSGSMEDSTRGRSVAAASMPASHAGQELVQEDE